MTYRVIFQPRLLMGLTLAALAPFASAQRISSILPSSFTPGKTTTVTAYGQGLAKATTLWTSFPATVTPQSAPADGQASFSVTVPADAPVGLQVVRLVTRTEISNARFVVIDDLVSSVDLTPSPTIAGAHKLTPPTAVDAISMPERSDFYSFTVAAGQRLAFEVVGHRFGADFDPLLRVLTKDGREILSHDNDEGLGFDCRFEHVFKEAGDYIVEVRDTRYQGSPESVYHLRIGGFPVARVAYPAGGKRGRWVSVAFPGRSATDVAAVDMEVPKTGMTDMLTVTTKGANASTWVPFVTDEKEQFLELEPNNQLSEGNAISTPRTINGRLVSPGDVDWFRFSATKGQKLVLKADTRRIGSPADILLRVVDGAGNQLVVVDDAGEEDARLEFAPPADGEYSVSVEDIAQRGGLAYVYRLEIAPAQADYQVVTPRDKIVLARGTSAPALAVVNRQGYGGAVELEATIDGQAPAPTSGLSVAPGKVRDGYADGVVMLSASVDAPLGLHTLALSGAATVDGQPARRAGIATGVIPAPLANGRLLPPSMLALTPILVTDRPLFTLAARVDAPAVGRFVKTPLVIAARKDKFFDEEIQLEITNLPGNVAVAAKPIPKGQRQVVLEIDSKANTPLGEFPNVIVVGRAVVRGEPLTIFANLVELAIKPAFALTAAAPAVKISPGGKVSVTVTANRLPAYGGPVAVTIGGLPAGVTAKAATITIPEKQTQAVFELAAAADAKPAAVDLSVKGAAKINGADEAATGPAVKLAVGP